MHERGLSKMPPSMKCGPILFLSLDLVKVSGIEIYGMNSTDIGDIKGAVMSEQKGYCRTVSKRILLSDTPSA